MMQVNSKSALIAGRELHDTFGNWSEVRKASDKAGGIYIVRKEAIDAARERHSRGRSKA